MRYESHPCALEYPLLNDDALDALAADIKEHGLKEKVTAWQPDPDKPPVLLDGRNRAEALRRAGIPLDEDTCVTLTGPAFNVAKFVLSKNEHRRHEHLTKEERAARILRVIEAGQSTESAKLAVSVKTRGAGGRLSGQTADPVLAEAVKQAARQGIGARTVERARAKTKRPEQPDSTAVVTLVQADGRIALHKADCAYIDGVPIEHLYLTREDADRRLLPLAEDQVVAVPCGACGLAVVFEPAPTPTAKAKVKAKAPAPTHWLRVGCSDVHDRLQLAEVLRGQGRSVVYAEAPKPRRR